MEWRQEGTEVAEVSCQDADLAQFPVNLVNAPNAGSCLVIGR